MTAPRRPTRFALAFAAILTSACAGDPVVARVESADTVVLSDGTRVRYAGVIAPGPGDPRFEESRRKNEEIVLDRRLTLVPAVANAPDADLTAFVYTPVQFEGRVMLLFVQGELARFGHVRAAIPQDTGEHARLYEDLQALEAEARRFARGQWAPPSGDEATHARP